MNREKNRYQLESLARLVSGRTPEREQKEYYAASGTPWVKIENLDCGEITETAEYLSELGREKVNLVPKGSVLFSIVGTVGKVGIAARELATNQQIVSLIFDESRILPLYGYYALRYHANEIRKLSNQTTMALISRKTLGQYRIYVPDSLEKQQEIVDKLQQYEAIKLKKEEMRSRMEVYEQTLFQRMFENELRYGEKMVLRQYLKEAVGSGIPKNEEPQGTFPCVRMEDFKKTYLQEKLERPESIGADWGISSKYQIHSGDVLVRNGKVLLVDQPQEPMYFDRSILKLTVDPGQILPEVLYAYLAQEQMQDVLYGARKENDSRKRPIRSGELERVEIPHFTMKKQKDYQDCLRKIREIEKNLDQEILLAEQAFSGIGWILLQEMPQKETEEKEAEQSVIPMQEENSIQEDALQQERVLDKKEKAPVSEEPMVSKKNTWENLQTARLILGVLCCWAPRDERTGSYCKKRQEIFRIAQPYFQPAAVSFTKKDGQKEYLLEKDFLTYHSKEICQAYEEPLLMLKELLIQMPNGKFADAHLAFQGEEGIATDALWSEEKILQMAAEGWKMILAYSGLEACMWLFS